MNYDHLELKEFDLEDAGLEDTAPPPLCLVHYFGADPPEPDPKPPGRGPVGRIAEQHGNVIILEFAPPPKTVQEETPQAKWQRARQSERVQLGLNCKLCLLLLLFCILGCLLASRF